MSGSFHEIRRFDPQRSLDFDEQFWPVVVAMSVLTALTIGSIITIARGPWMWFSLLAVPALVAGSLWLLFRMQNRFWRRSIQAALILSLAFHLAVLIVAYRAEIFARSQVMVATQAQSRVQPRRIEISVQASEETWNQPNELETPQPELEVTREPENQPTPEEVRPTPLPSDQQSPSPQLTRRNNTAETTPKTGAELSQQSRQSVAHSQQSRQPQIAQAAPQTDVLEKPTPELKSQVTSVSRDDPSPTPNVTRRQNQPAESERAEQRNSLQRQERPAEIAAMAAREPTRATTAVRNPEVTQPVPQPTTSASRAASQPAETQPASTPVARESAPSLTQKQNIDTPSRPSAVELDRRRNDENPAAVASERSARRQPLTSDRAPNTTNLPENKTVAASRSETAPQPARESSRLTRQQTEAVATITNVRPAESPNQASTDARSRNLQRLQVNNNANPAFAAPEVTAASNQLAQRAPQTTSAVNSLAVPSDAPRHEPSPSARPVALERANDGTAGKGASVNLDRASQSSMSPAFTAADSSRRERATSPESATETLSPSQETRVSQSTAGLTVPKHTLAANSQTGTRPASPRWAETTASSAAAVTSATAASETGETAVDKGGAEVDVGPQKIVGSDSVRAVSGGGRPELNQIQPAETADRASGGGGQPAIKVDAIAATTTNQGATGDAPAAASEESPSSAAQIAARSGADVSVSQGPSRSPVADASLSESSQARDVESQIASRRSANENAGKLDAAATASPQERNQRARAVRDLAIDGSGVASTDRPSTGESNSESDPETSAAQIELARGDGSGRSTTEKSSSNLSGATAVTTQDDRELRRNQGRGSSATGELAPADSAAALPQASPRALTVASGSSGDMAGEGRAPDEARDALAARSIEPARAAGMGVSSIGPAATEATVSATESEPLVALNGRRASRSQTEQASVGAAESRPATPTVNGLSASASPLVPSSRINGAGASTDPAAVADAISPATRTESAGAQIDVDWTPGPGGLASEYNPDLGVRSRRASANSDVLALEPTRRFRQPDSSGKLSISPQGAIARSPFAGRSPSNLPKLGPQTEASIEAGLAFLARHQHPDGRWSLLGFDEDDPAQRYQMDSDTAATGLAVLAFQGAGYTHLEYKFAKNVQGGIQWLIDHQQPSGLLYVESDEQSNKNCRLYSHAIATLALTEAYGMTQDSQLREPAQKAVDFLVRTQDRQNGGWRYYDDPPSMRRTDTSVTGWVVMALHSARLAGIEFDQGVWKGIGGWLDIAQMPNNPSQYRYDPNAGDAPTRVQTRPDGTTIELLPSGGRDPTKSMTAVGLLIRLYMGWDKRDARFLNGANELLRQLPGERNEIERDTYYWYYATQVLRHVDGVPWQTWSSVLHPLLVKSQETTGPLAGSWHPYRPVEDRWGKNGGRIYVTTLNLLSLEVDYRLLPLYESSSDPRPEDR